MEGLPVNRGRAFGCYLHQEPDSSSRCHLPKEEDFDSLRTRLLHQCDTQLRTAMIHYRSLFEELVQVPMTLERKEVA